MRKTAAVALVAMAALLFIAAVPSEASASEPPSLGDVFSTVELPDYSFDTFMEDFGTVFSPQMAGDAVHYVSEMFTYLTTDTFLDSSYQGGFGDSYVNVFLAICLLLIVLCIIGAVVAYLRYRNHSPSEE